MRLVCVRVFVYACYSVSYSSCTSSSVIFRYEVKLGKGDEIDDIFFFFYKMLYMYICVYRKSKTLAAIHPILFTHKYTYYLCEALQAEATRDIMYLVPI